MANDGGPAFPSDSRRVHEFGISGSNNAGMSLRDYFAAKAMQGAIAGAMADGTKWAVAVEPKVASMAYRMADAMLAARGDA